MSKCTHFRLNSTHYVFPSAWITQRVHCRPTAESCPFGDKPAKDRERGSRSKEMEGRVMWTKCEEAQNWERKCSTILGKAPRVWGRGNRGHGYVHGPTSPIKLSKCMQQSPQLVNRALAWSKVSSPGCLSQLCLPVSV